MSGVKGESWCAALNASQRNSLKTYWSSALRCERERSTAEGQAELGARWQQSSSNDRVTRGKGGLGVGVRGRAHGDDVDSFATEMSAFRRWVLSGRAGWAGIPSWNQLTHNCLNKTKHSRTTVYYSQSFSPSAQRSEARKPKTIHIIQINLCQINLRNGTAHLTQFNAHPSLTRWCRAPRAIKRNGLELMN